MNDKHMPIRLWAPFATSAFAIVDNQRLPMSIDTPGYWKIDLPVGCDYLLAIDDHEPHPDPRSSWQPDGVDGPSRVFDPTDFAWTDQEWQGIDLSGSVFYEIHVGTFTAAGTLDSAIDKLAYLAALGVQTIELMPVVAFAGTRGWGYDGVDLYSVHDSYGGPRALQRFVDAAHQRGLAVCLDVVYNHFGPSGNYAPTFAPYFKTERQTPWGDAINLDGDHCRGVRDFICDNAIRWLTDFHIDALRIDAVHALIDDSSQHILSELSERVDALRPSLGRSVALIAESDLNQDSAIKPRGSGGMGLDGQWNDDVHHALHAYLTGERFGYYVDFGDASTLSYALEHVFVHDGCYSTFRKQRWGSPVSPELNHNSFVVFTQNHDQVGNRGMGDRPESRLPSGAVACGAALILLSSFTPMLFQGQEWMTKRPFQFFTDYDPELSEAVRKGRLAEFQGHNWESVYGSDPKIPDPGALSTFTNSTLDWSELKDPKNMQMLSWYRTLISLRHRFFPVGGGKVKTDFSDTWFRMVHGPLTVVICPGCEPAELTEPRSEICAIWGNAHHDGLNLHLSPHSAAVLID